MVRFKAYRRLRRFKRIRQEKINRILEVKRYLDEWHDIPMRELYPSACEMLHIRCDEAAKNLVIKITLPRYSAEELSRMLP